ncbi:MAG: universal stress protein, partial [Rhodospirillales bacterium]|nr:universal stress protein [Rhodospirillales bacterium]
MSEEIQTDESGKKEFTFLCVVDDSDELSQALRFSCARAKRVGGRVSLLYVIEPAEFQHWATVGDLMLEERRQEAEELLSVISAIVQKRTGKMPLVYIREGIMYEQLMELIEEELDISLLVLGAATGSDGPG